MLLAGLALLSADLVFLWLASPSVGWLFVALTAWAFATDLLWPSQQRRIVELVPQLRGVALALTASFVFCGIGLGSAVAGWIYPALGFAGVIGSSLLFLALATASLKISRASGAQERPFDNIVVDRRRARHGDPVDSRSMEMPALAPKSNRIQTAPEYLRVNLSEPLHVDDLAKAVHLSIRQFGRIFLSETGEFPAKALERLRLEAARDMIERRRYSLETIASEAEFVTDAISGKFLFGRLERPRNL
ncbi:conserved hypothetical protein [Ricinus communis]|uniref:HTH araC/xylS-type domain-containing protein n=1 Tax=Ricinus communis TaxID=3988 RepID=B9TCT7_RICCO|nr:conserved hypothetical protein [Ricinus communis]